MYSVDLLLNGKEMNDIGLFGVTYLIGPDAFKAKDASLLLSKWIISLLQVNEYHYRAIQSRGNCIKARVSSAVIPTDANIKIGDACFSRCTALVDVAHFRWRKPRTELLPNCSRDFHTRVQIY